MRQHARRLGKPLTGIAPRAMDRLLAYSWPGNVRELANVIERAAIVSTGTVLGEDDLPPLAGPAVGVADSRASSPTAEGTLESIERAHILRVLERTGWVIEGKSGAAAILGVAPSTLRSRMTQLGIRRS